MVSDLLKLLRLSLISGKVFCSSSKVPSKFPLKWLLAILLAGTRTVLLAFKLTLVKSVSAVSRRYGSTIIDENPPFW